MQCSQRRSRRCAGPESFSKSSGRNGFTVVGAQVGKKGAKLQGSWRYLLIIQSLHLNRTKNKKLHFPPL